MIKNLILCALLFCVGVANEKFYNELFIYYGAKYQVPPMLLWAIAKTESNFNANAKNIDGNYKVSVSSAPSGTIVTNTNGSKKSSFKYVKNCS